MVNGSLALVTGASSGIGRATCKVLAREGATVIATDIDEVGAQETLNLLSGSGHSVYRHDVSDFQSSGDLLKTIVQKYKRPPNILVNCAGIFNVVSIFEETPESFQRLIDVNLKGSFFTSQAVCKELIAAELPGSIVNISSVASFMGNAAVSVYSASKAGVDAITKCMAKDMSQYNIRVNSVQPGWIETPMTVKLSAMMNLPVETWTSQLATKRTGQPHEVAELIVFLTSDRASYINGAHISITGGM